MKGSFNADQTIAVEGLAELSRVFRRLDKTARRELKDKLKSVGQLVADEASSQAKAKGLVESGKLARMIRPRVFARGVAIVAGAMKRSPGYPQGFNYPRRHEFDEGGARAFMRPALEAKQGEVIVRFEEIFIELEREWERD